MPGNHYFSNLIIQKLSMFLRKEMFWALGHTYPSLREVFFFISIPMCIMELTKFKASSAKSYKSEWGSSNTHK